MKKWLELPRLIEFLGLIAIFIIIWFAFPFIEIHGKNIFARVFCRLTLIGSLLFIWFVKVIFFNIFNFFSAKRADSQLIEAYIKNEDSGLDQKEEMKEKVKKITKNIQQDFLTTKESRFFWRRKSLRKLPWFLVIGSYSSGKTSVVYNAGLDVSYRIDRGDGIKEHDSGMFITHDAVFVEVARYWNGLEEDGVDIKKETDLLLLSLLQELKKYRGRKAINGILFTVDISDVLELPNENTKAKISATKRQLQIICKNLNSYVPFYLLFTKCDFISGFKEFFANLTEEERKQAWGVSFPVDCPRFSEAVIFEKAYGTLINNLNQTLFIKLQAERSLQFRENINLFPGEMKLLQEPINNYVKEYLNDSYIQDHLWARGIYFSSCSQDEDAHYSLVAAIAGKFNLAVDLSNKQSHSGSGLDSKVMRESRVYFLDRLFKDIILQEIHLERKNKSSRQKRFWLNFFFYGTAFFAVVVGASVISVYRVTNEYDIKEAYNYLLTYRLQRAKIDMNNYNLVEVLPVLSLLNQARLVYFDSEPDWIVRLDPYQLDAKLEKNITEVLYRELYKIFLPKIIGRIEELLLEYSNSPVSLNEALQAYLFFGKHPAGSINKEMVRLVMIEDWRLNFNNTPEEIKRLKYYLDLILNSSVDPVALNNDLILQATKILGKITIPELIFATLEKQSKRKEMQLDISPFDLTNKIDSSFYKVFSDESEGRIIQETGKKQSLTVPGFYTSKGFIEYFSIQAPVMIEQILEERKMLDWYLFPSQTVPSENSKEDQGAAEQILEQVKDLYAKKYLSCWNDLLYGLKIVKFNSLGQAISVLDLLEEENAVFSEVIRVTKQNTSIDVQGGKINIGDIFKPFNRVLDNTNKQGKTEIENTNQAISDFKNFLIHLKNNPKSGQARFEAVKKRFAGNLKDDPINNLRIQAAKSPEPLKAWLYDLVDQCWDIVLLGAKLHVNEMWSSVILNPYSKSLAEYYPLSAESKTEIDLEVFSDFFGNSGTIDGFFKQYIAPFIDVSQTPWKLYECYGAHFKVEETTVPFFAHAANIRDLYFMPKSANIALSFSIKPILLDPKAKSIKLDLGHNSITYKHGPQRAMNLKWSQKDTMQPIVITLNDFKGETYTNNIIGEEWSIFKLFRESQLRFSNLFTSGMNNYLFTVGAGDYQAIFEISSQKNIDAFLLKPLLDFKLPVKL